MKRIGKITVVIGSVCKTGYCSGYFIPFAFAVWSVLCGTAASVFASENPQGYRMPENRREVIYSDDFSLGMKNWKANSAGEKSFFVKKGAGENGSEGVIYERKDPYAGNGILCYRFKGEPAKRYRAEVRCKIEGAYDREISNDELLLHVLCVRHYDKKGKLIRRRTLQVPMKGNADRDWEKITIEFEVPMGTEESEVGLCFYKNKTGGIIYFDNFTLEKTGTKLALLYPIMPKQHVLAKDGKFLFRIHDYKGRDEKTLLFRMRFNGKDYDAEVSGGMAELKVQVPPTSGKYPCTMWLLDRKNKQIAGVEQDIYRVLSGREKLPVGAAKVARDGSLKVDGRNFLPVGIFISDVKEHFTEPVIRRIRDAGFNSVLRYYSLKMDLNAADTEETASKRLLKSMDHLHALDMKSIFCVKEQVYGGIQRFDDVYGSLNVGEYAAKLIGNHPALLAWYVSDENQLEDMPKIRNLRRRISLVDPNHPVITLTHIPANHLEFGQTGDVLMPDCYPIGGPMTQQMQSIRRHFPTGKNASGLGYWFTPQAFHWGAYMKPWSKFRYPTAEEMRSMVLLAMNCGAKGYVFYSYSPIFLQQEKADPGSSEKFWKDVVPAAKILRELEDFHFATVFPRVEVENKGGSVVDAKAYRTGGRIAVVVTSETPGEAHAVLKIRGTPKLRSRFGKTVRNQDGSYTFRGRNISSDVLFSD